MFNNSSRLTNYIRKPVIDIVRLYVGFVWSSVLRNTFQKWRKLTSPSTANWFRQSSGNRGIGARRFNILWLGVIIYAGSFTTVSYQDMQSLKPTKDRWLVHLPEAPGQTVATASLFGFDTMITGSIPREHHGALGSDEIMGLTSELPKTPKAPAINRKLIGDRVVSSTIQRPPAHFSAGTVLRRQSLLSPLEIDKNQSLAFVKPKSSLEAFKIASAFHTTGEKQNRDLKNLPVMVASLVRESKDSILSYAPEQKVKYSPFAAVLRDEGPISIIPKLNDYDHSWADDPLPKMSFSDEQQKCLASGIYFEARGEPVRGQAAVAQVILNRVRNPTYPNSICGVVYQNKHRRNRCQFSFACDRIRDRVRNKRLWHLAQNVAKETIAGRIWLSEVGSSTHYHASYVRPKWAKRMKRVGKIGLHIFYRTKGGGWS